MTTGSEYIQRLREQLRLQGEANRNARHKKARKLRRQLAEAHAWARKGVFEEGATASARNAPCSANPYEPGTDDHVVWRRGWVLVLEVQKGRRHALANAMRSLLDKHAAGTLTEKDWQRARAALDQTVETLEE